MRKHTRVKQFIQSRYSTTVTTVREYAGGWIVDTTDTMYYVANWRSFGKGRTLTHLETCIELVGSDIVLTLTPEFSASLRKFLLPVHHNSKQEAA